MAFKFMLAGHEIMILMIRRASCEAIDPFFTCQIEEGDGGADEGAIFFIDVVERDGSVFLGGDDGYPAGFVKGFAKSLFGEFR